VEKKNIRNPILESLNYLFYVSKVLGMIPYSLSDYITKKQFKLSQVGGIFGILSCIHYATHYHFLNIQTMIEKEDEKSIGTLTTVIGIFIIYMEPLMMAIDVIASLVNQKSLIDVFERLREIDEKLAKENILLDYRVIRRYSIIFMSIAFIGEITLGIANLFAFQETLLSFESLWWLTSCIPLFNNGVSKTYFLILILLVQQRLRAINTHLNDTKKVFFERKVRHVNGNASLESNLKKDNLFIENIGYLEKEIFSTRNMKIKNGNDWKWVGNSGMTNRVNDINVLAQKKRGIINVAPYDPSRGGGRIGDWKRSKLGCLKSKIKKLFERFQKIQNFFESISPRLHPLLQMLNLILIDCH
jgi:gustatory receptor